jgi:hypothetical protein
MGKCGEVLIFGNDSDKSKFNLRRNEGQMNSGRCLLTLGPESRVVGTSFLKT